MCSKEDREYLLWLFLKNMLERLGAEGDSSDETEIDETTLETVYRVKVMFWRRDLSKYLKMIDAQRDDPNCFSTKGSKGVRRLPARDMTRRQPVKELPRMLYDDDWFNQIDTERRSLHMRVSKKEFEWLEIHDAVNDWN